MGWSLEARGMAETEHTGDDLNEQQKIKRDAKKSRNANVEECKGTIHI